jgi:hypothetical protein
MTSEINDPLTIKRNYRKSLECTNLDYVPDIELGPSLVQMHSLLQVGAENARSFLDTNAFSAPSWSKKCTAPNTLSLQQSES